MTDNGRSDTIEFVARQISYDGYTVQTKATTVNNFENQIHNCYLLLFNTSSGEKVYGPISLSDLTSQRVSRHELTSKLGGQTTCTACFIANVPTSEVNKLSTLTAVNDAVLDINYSSLSVEDSSNSNKESFFSVPQFDLSGNGTAVQCMPMFGMGTCDLSSADIFQVPLKRLFAKVSVSMGVSSTSAEFDILATHLFNLPKKVKLIESSDESKWVKSDESFVIQQIVAPIVDDNITGGVAGYLSNAYEFYFYVPEYYLSSTDDGSGNYGNQKFKPNMFDTDKLPVFVRVYGKYKDNLITNSQDVTYDLYLGENASTSFTLKRNMYYKNLVKVNGITNSKDGEGTTLDCRVDVSRLNDVEVFGQTANCYIIGSTGTYKYPAVKGVWKGGLNNIPDSLKCTKGTNLRILKQDNDGIKLENLVYDSEACEFSFDITAIDTGTGAVSSNDGNIILTLEYTEGGKVKTDWSWHFWFVNGALLGMDAFEVESDQYPSGKYLMDRNLGARITLLLQETPGVADGLYYKYGHKEPYMINDYQGGGESTSYTWNSEKKSQTDPCPPGYRVPQSSVWDGNATKAHAAIPGVVESFRFWDNGSPYNILDDIYFPYSGYIDANKKPQAQGYGTRDTTSNYSVNIPESQTKVGYSVAANYADGGVSALNPKNKTGPAIFTDVKYSKYDISNLGILSAQDKELRYGYTEAGTDIISCKVKIGKWVSDGGNFLNPKYTADFKSFGDAKTLTGDQLKSQYEDTYKRLVAVINGKNGSNSESLGDAIMGYFQEPETTFSLSNITNSNGYQVRCVKE